MYLKTTYRNHCEEDDSKCADHCRVFALSHAGNTDVQKVCSHSHNVKCEDCEKLKLKDLEMIHIRAARLIHKIPNSFGDNDVLSKVGWMPLEYFYKLRILTITYNAYYNLGLREINCLVTKNSNSYNLRKSLNVVLNRPKTELGRRSFAHRSAVAWNALPDNVKDSPNLSIFKYNLKQSKQTVMNINFEKGGNVIQNMKPNFHYY